MVDNKNGSWVFSRASRTLALDIWGLLTPPDLGSRYAGHSAKKSRKHEVFTVNKYV